ncbi:nucleotidyltransferase domain-containing protein [bacterium]|nr:nucleotidyltransferase domain-containing protein [bacterium]MBU1614886.1 nucleotidyltransferase domain-containing protein [bacterium]
MAGIPDEAVEKIKEFLDMVEASGLSLEMAIVFGSYVTGKAGKWSDIDIALVCKDFTGIRFYDRKKLNPSLIKTDKRIEIHPFRPEDFTEKDPFAKQIIRYGVKIPISNRGSA